MNVQKKFCIKVILLTAIEALREEKKNTKQKRKKGTKKKRKKRFDQTLKTDTPLESASRPRSTSHDMASVESAEAWTEQRSGTTSYQLIDCLKIMGRCDSVILQGHDLIREICPNTLLI